MRGRPSADWLGECGNAASSSLPHTAQRLPRPASPLTLLASRCTMARTAGTSVSTALEPPPLSSWLCMACRAQAGRAGIRGGG